jgi:hypothetical protein
MKHAAPAATINENPLWFEEGALLACEERLGGLPQVSQVLV